MEAGWVSEGYNGNELVFLSKRLPKSLCFILRPQQLTVECFSLFPPDFSRTPLKCINFDLSEVPYNGYCNSKTVLAKISLYQGKHKGLDYCENSARRTSVMPLT